MSNDKPTPDPDHGPQADPPTMVSNELMLFVQSIKGAPASVLLALGFTGRYMSHGELQLWTRCGKNQITIALQALVKVGWAVGRTSRGPWALARALGAPQVETQGGGFPLKGLSSGSDPLNHSNGGTLLPSPFRRDLLEALREAGIREPTASELSELPHVTPEYVNAHVAAARKLGLRLGAAIEGMRRGAPPPQATIEKDRHAEGEAKFRRFLEGG